LAKVLFYFSWCRSIYSCDYFSISNIPATGTATLHRKQTNW